MSIFKIDPKLNPIHKWSFHGIYHHSYIAMNSDHIFQINFLKHLDLYIICLGWSYLIRIKIGSMNNTPRLYYIISL